MKGVLSRTTTHAFHRDVYDCNDDSAYFLFVVRDPLDRARSAYYYDYPKFPRFYNKTLHCNFFQWEDYAHSMTANTNAPEDCRRVAKKTLRGLVPYHRGPSHLLYNFQYYFEAVPKDAPILVIRNEHIQADWNSAEKLLGRKRDRLNMDEATIPRNNANTSQRKQDLTDESTATLCEVLCNEIQVYKTILRRAENINEEQLQISLMELEAKCPVQAISDECLDPMPDISLKLQDHRGYRLQGDGKFVES